ncbi:MAG: hypothetical protein EOP39_22730, partial [Rubrivivax sp.]
MSSQTAGDCKQRQCDGSGQVVTNIDNADLPVDDGIQCTAEICTAGVPAHPPTPSSSACNQNGGTLCNGSGTCVECLVASTCPGTDTECRARTCTSGTCGLSNASAGTPVSSQTAGDCQQNSCDGNGNTITQSDNTDLPVDGNACTSDVCTAGVPSNPLIPAGTTCGTAQVCSAGGECVGCVTANDCPGLDNSCQTRTCTAGTCGFTYEAVGTAVGAQTPGDCKKVACDGAGNTTTQSDNTDLPVDNIQCTSDVCTAGVPSNPAAALNTTCSQNGGSFCTSNATCVACNTSAQCPGGSCVNNACVAAPTVVSITPSDAATSVALPAPIVVTFSTAMSPASLASQTVSGACSGTIQVSIDNFASCVGFAASAPVMSGGNTVATVTPKPGLLVNTTYKVRVTTAAQSSAGTSLASAVTQATGFTTGAPAVLCDGSLVISQLFGGATSGSALYKGDFVELHNRGTTAISLNGKSIQYANTTGNSWQVATLPDVVVLAGKYYLVSLVAGSGQADLPTADFSATNINLGGTAGKVALVNGTTALSVICPTGTTILDFVGYGSGTNCSEQAVAPAPSTTTLLVRGNSGCRDMNNNSTDFTAASTTTVRNSGSPAVGCDCKAINETAVASVEADFCNIQSPLSLSVKTGLTSGLIYGQIYEAGLTDAATVNGALVLAQIGYGPLDSNPQYESGWVWSSATFNKKEGNNYEYQASFTAPAAGNYRYVYRYSLNGTSWTYGDINGAG